MNNSYKKNLEMHQNRLKQERKEFNNQEQLGKKKFQDIATERYQAKIGAITGKNVNANEIQERAKARKKEMDNLKNITYNKYWGK